MNTSFEPKSQAPKQKAPHQESQSAKVLPSRTIVHAKLEMTEPGDYDEQEADAVASTIMSGGKIARKISSGGSGSSGIAVSQQMESQLNHLQGGGQSMPEGLRSMMESGFGRDFSQVRLHTDSEAASMSNSIHAKAFTHGNDIYFNHGQFSPETSEGQHLIAHELTHVLQGGEKVGRRKKNKPEEVIVFDEADTILGMSLYERRKRIDELLGEVRTKKEDIMGAINANFTICNKAVTEFVKLIVDREFVVADKILNLGSTINGVLSLIGSVGSVASFVMGLLLSEAEKDGNSEKSKLKRNCEASFEENLRKTMKEDIKRESEIAEEIVQYFGKVQYMLNCIEFEYKGANEEGDYEIGTCLARVIESDQSQLEEDETNRTKVGNVAHPKKSDIISTDDVDVYEKCERITEKYKNRKVLEIKNQKEFLHQLIIKFFLVARVFNVRYDFNKKEYVDGSFLGKNSQLVDALNETMYEKSSATDKNFNYNVLAPVLLQEYHEMISNNKQLSDKDFTLVYKTKGKEYVNKYLFWKYANRFLKHYGKNTMQLAKNEFAFNRELTMSDKELLSRVVDHIREHNN